MNNLAPDIYKQAYSSAEQGRNIVLGILNEIEYVQSVLWLILPEDNTELNRICCGVLLDNYLENKELNQTRQDLTEDITNKVMELISICKDFYCFNSDEQKFRNTVCMRCSPSGNKDIVKKWWKDHYDVDIEIEERNPLLFWEQDYYGDNFEEIMEEEDGPDWKEKWDKKWKDQVAAKKAEYEARLKELQKEYDTENKEVAEG